MMNMYGATSLADCLTVVRTAGFSSSVTYHLEHKRSGEWGTLWWENETSRPCWLLVTSEDGGNWTQYFFLPPEDLPDVIESLFLEGWTWLK
jgi:hypothetical protein